MANNENQSSEKKPWEVPWSFDQIRDSATSWSLAGNAGLLLSLKQMSEGMMNQTSDLEKTLDNLIYKQKQCETKLNNITNGFLMLENTQFIENLVTEDDAEKAKEEAKEVKQEKTKEEKDAEMFSKINEALQIGMSIMDVYFEKLDSKKLVKEQNGDVNGKNENEDDEDDKSDDMVDEDDDPNLVIYEPKDPYILRSLPYLIGSPLYLENDHVGLKDDFEEEEEQIIDDDKAAGGDDNEEDDDESEDEDEDDDDDTDAEDKKKPTVTKTNQKNDSESDNDDLFAGVGDKKKSNKSLFDNDDGDDDDDDGDLFKSVKSKKKENLFDDDDEEEEEKEEDEKKKVKEEEKVEEKVEKSDDDKPALDFAAELAKRFKNKSKEASGETKKQPVNEAVEEKKVTKPATTVPIDKADDDDDDDDLFNPKQAVTKATNNDALKSKPKVANLFDDSSSNEEDDLFSNKKIKQPPQQQQQQQAKKVNLIANDDDDEEGNDFQIEKKKVNFDDDDEEADDEEQIKQPKLPSGAKSLFKGQSALLESALQQRFNTDKRRETIDNDSEEDKKPVKKEEEKSVKEPKKTPGGLFGDDDDDEDDLFKPVKSVPKKEEKKPSKIDNDELFNTKPKETSNKSIEIKKEEAKPVAVKKVSLFGGGNDDDEQDDDDLFSAKPKPPAVAPTKSVEKPLNIPASTTTAPVAQKKPTSLFDDEDEDDLFKASSKPAQTPVVKPVVEPPVVKPVAEPPVPVVEKQQQQAKAKLFDDDEDDLFSSKKTKNDEIKVEQKQTEQPKKPVKNEEQGDDLFGFNNLPDIDDGEAKAVDKSPTLEKKSVLLINKNQKSDSLFAELNKKLVKPAIKDENENEKPVEPVINETTSKSIVNETKKTAVSLLSGSNDDEDDDDLFSAKKTLKEEPKKEIFIQNKSDKSDNLFAELNKNLKTDIKQPETTITTTPVIKPPLLESDETSEDDLFSKNTKPKTTAAAAAPTLTTKSAESVSKLEETKSQVVKNPLLSVSEEDNDNLFKPVSKPFKPVEEAKPTIEETVKKTPISASKPVEELPAASDTTSPSASSIKKLQTNLLINPAMLLPGAKPPGLNKPTPKVDDDDDLFNDVKKDEKSSPTVTIKAPETQSKSIGASENPFNLDVDRTFNDQTMRNAQKDRIKVSQKKRPPSNRKAVAVSQDDIGEIEEEKPVISVKKIEEPVKKASELTPPQPSLFEPPPVSSILKDEKADDDLDLFKNTKSTTTAKTQSIKLVEEPLLIDKNLLNASKTKPSNLDKTFSDEIDLFADVDLLNSKPTSTTTTTTATNKQATVQDQPKKETKRKADLNKILADDTDLFADVDLLTSKTTNKKEQDAKTKPTKKIVDDDIFNDDLASASKPVAKPKVQKNKNPILDEDFDIFK